MPQLPVNYQLNQLRCRVAQLEKELHYLKRCAKQLFDNDRKLDAWTCKARRIVLYVDAPSEYKFMFRELGVEHSLTSYANPDPVKFY